MSRNVFSKQTTNRIIIFAIKVNIFLDAMKVVKFCTTSTIKHSTRDHLKKKIYDIITQPTVVGLSSVLNKKNCPFSQTAPL